MLIAEAIWERARHDIYRTAVVDEQQSLTFADLAFAVASFAHALTERGVGAGQRVICQLPNSCGLLVVTLACQRIGAVPILLLMAHRKRELLQVMEMLDPAAAVTLRVHRGHPHAHELEAVIAQRGMNIPVIAYEAQHCRVVPSDRGRVVLDSLGERFGLDSPASDDDDAVILISGGTTGRPKLVPHTHRDYYHALTACRDVSRITSNTVYLAALPAAHNFTLASPGVLGVLIAGGTVIFSQTPSPRKAIPLIAHHSVTMTAIVPSVAQRWLDDSAGRRPQDVQSLEVIQVGGADTTPSMVRELRDAFGVTVQRVYGMSEGFVSMTRLDDSAEVVENSVGTAVSTRDAIRIAKVPVGCGMPGTGELLTRGESTVRGYLVAGGRTDRRAFDSDGWYHTGDLARVRPDGRLQIKGRVSDLVNRGGDMISLVEVETLLREIPGVRSAAAVGMPHAELGECVAAGLICDAGVQVGVADVRRHFRDAGSSHLKVPEIVQVLDAIPQTAMGKTDRAQLRSVLTKLDTGVTGEVAQAPNANGSTNQHHSPVLEV